ncbi:MAG: hypothetical protein P9M13_02510 [Candidatus Ancaeobacter aquaticus]|nr:hypothetical protein [Candidatus Ancaeobacter aquaticus]
MRSIIAKTLADSHLFLHSKPVSSEKNRDYINEKVDEINPQQDKYKTKAGRIINNTVKATGQGMDFADQLRTDK